MKVFSHIGRDNLRFVGNEPHVGIEWELEGSYTDRIRSGELLPSEIFKLEADNTLRNNGIEVILRKPMVGDDLREAISIFYDLVDFNQLKNSELCSTHIHINVLPLSYKQVVAAALMAAVHDINIFTEFDSEDRIENVYCTPVYSSPTFYTNVRSLYLNRPTRITEQKYKSVNITTCTRGNPLGTLEFRHFNIFEEQESLLKAVYKLQTIVANAAKLPVDATREEVVKFLMTAEKTKVRDNVITLTEAVVCAE